MASLEASAGPGAHLRGKTLCFLCAFLASGACTVSNRDPAANGSVSNEAGLVTVVGRLTSEGVECQALRGDDGQLYTLLGGDPGSLRVETRVRVLGERLEFSSCQQGITIRVRSITPADPQRNS